MSFRKTKRAGPGRPPGAKNKKTDLFALCAELKVDVMREMIEMAVACSDPDYRFAKMRDIAPYLYAKKKEVLNLDQHPVEELLEAAEKMLTDESE